MSDLNRNLAGLPFFTISAPKLMETSVLVVGCLFRSKWVKLTALVIACLIISNACSYDMHVSLEKALHEIIFLGIFGNEHLHEVDCDKKLWSSWLLVGAFNLWTGFNATGSDDPSELGDFRLLNSPLPRQNGRHFAGRHFEIYFREWKVLYLDSNFTELCS